MCVFGCYIDFCVMIGDMLFNFVVYVDDCMEFINKLFIEFKDKVIVDGELY